MNFEGTETTAFTEGREFQVCAAEKQSPTTILFSFEGEGAKSSVIRRLLLLLNLGDNPFKTHKIVLSTLYC